MLDPRTGHILESITDEFFAVDREWRFTYIDERALASVRRGRGEEIKREDVLGKNVWEAFPEIVVTPFYEKYHEAMREQKPVRFEAYSPLRNTWNEVHAYPSEEGLSVYIQDITERKRAEEQLRYHAYLLENVHDAVIGTDEKLLVTVWNKGAERMYGWKPEEVLGRHIWEAIPIDLSEEELADVLRELSQRGQFRVEAITYAKDGTPVWVEGITIALRDGEPEEGRITGYVNIRRDITETKRAEEKLQNALYDACHYATQLQELSEAGLLINSALSLEELLQAITDQARAIIGAHMSVTGFTVDENYAQTVDAVSLSDKYARWREYDARPDGTGIYSLVARTNHPMRMTQAELEAHPAYTGFSRAAGEHPPLRGWLSAPMIGRNGENIGLIQLSDKYEGEFNDTDEAILVQLAHMASVALENARLYQESQAAEHRYRELVQGLDAIVWEAYVADSRFSFVSHRAVGILGYPLAEWLAEPDFLKSRAHLDDRQFVESFYDAARSWTKNQEVAEYRVLAADGSEVWLRDKVRVVRDAESRPLQLTGLMVDITEIKNAEEELSKVREEERSRIARDLHDEALQDLAGAMAEAQLARRATTGETELSERLERLSEALKRVEQRIRGAVYDLGLEVERDRPFAELLRDLVELQRSLAADADVRLEVEDGVLSEPLEDTGKELLRILGEGLANARRHSGARNVLVRVWRSEGKLLAEVEDDGRGFDPARVGSATAAGGAGLRGMRERARAIGGTLKIESEPAMGTRVLFEMASKESRESPEGKVRVLLVEDHVTVREAIASAFEQEGGFDVVGQAGSLAEARRLLEEVRPIKIAIVDLGLPDGYGGDLIKDLRESNQQTQALVLSASRDREQIARAVEAGAAGILNKTTHLEEVVESVRRLRAGETLMPLEEVVELLRFAGSRREEEYEARQAISHLSPREMEVLRLLAEGLDSEGISDRLHISLRTERNHMASILKKLGVHSQLQALVFALRHGAIEIP